MQDKNPYIVYIKAVGIILMVLGHCGCAIPYMVQFLYMFHMPLFFFASGYCFKSSSLDFPKQFLKKRIKGLYWPYIKWNMFFLVFYNFFVKRNICEGDLYGLSDIAKHTFNIIYHMTDAQPLLGGYWFLSALFSGLMISWCLLKLFKIPEVGGAFL